MQINTGGLEGERFGFAGKEMVGLDEASRQKCVAAGARAFAGARERCAPARLSTWFERSVASYGTGGACEADQGWVAARVSTFERIGAINDRMLSKEVRALLGLGLDADSPSP
jgi:hypothetical protein